MTETEYRDVLIAVVKILQRIIVDVIRPLRSSIDIPTSGVIRLALITFNKFLIINHEGSRGVE